MASESGFVPPDVGFDFTRPLRFFFEDPHWVSKLLVGSLFTVLSLFFIGNFWIAGYVVRTIRSTARGAKRPLPDWDDLGGVFKDGLPAVVVVMAHFIPVTLIVVVLVLALGGATAVYQMNQGVASGVRVLLLVLAIFGYAIFSFLCLALMLYVPAALARSVLLDRLGGAFELRENIAFIRRNLRTYSQAVTAFLIAGLFAQFAIVVFCVGIFPATFWSAAVLGYGLGEVGKGDKLTQSLVQ